MTPDAIRREKALDLAVIDAAIQQAKILDSLPGDDLWMAVVDLAEDGALDDSVEPEHVDLVKSAATKYAASLATLRKVAGRDEGVWEGVRDQLTMIRDYEDLAGYRRAVEDLHEHAISVRKALDALAKKWPNWEDEDVESSIWEQVEEVPPARLKKLRALEDEKWDLVFRLKQERAIVQREQRKFWNEHDMGSRFRELVG